MSRVIDLDAARAARAELNPTGPVARFGGQEFQLPVELPFAIAQAASGTPDDLRDAVKSLMGEQYAQWSALNPSLMDIQALFEALPGMYGLGDLPN